MADEKSGQAKFSIFTLGCKVNQYESDRLAQDLVARGLHPAEEGEAAGLVIVNTCTVTGRAAQQSRQAVRAELRKNPGAVALVSGCDAATEPGSFSSIPGVAGVLGNADKARAADLALRALGLPFEASPDAYSHPDFAERRSPVLGKRSRPFLKIQDGCNSRCTYCAVPGARGRSRSMDAGEVLRHLSAIAAAGYAEVVLTGVHLGDFGRDRENDGGLAGLLARAAVLPAAPRIRLSSLEPNDLGPEVLSLFASGPFLRPHLHLPLQSGSDPILRRMNRPYSAAFFRDLVLAVREKLPLAAIGVDVMVGFPGETEEHFSQTLALLCELPVSYLHVFPYSPRRGTPAASFPGRPESAEQGRRASALRKLSRQKRAAFGRDMAGRILDAVVEGPAPEQPGLFRGTCENYIPVLFSSEHFLRSGSSVMVRILDAERQGFARALLASG
ncbi:MAG: tRNA (N(6)-L-threonylcarbamoyladenosine(37)-C(2))-methylthiotransferase MtaB [Thermodesulfobacteriota bacterium]